MAQVAQAAAPMMPAAGQIAQVSAKVPGDARTLGINNVKGTKELLGHPISILLIFVPLGIMSGSLEWGDTCTFWFNFCAMVPLAKILGDATEELGKYTNQLVTGLINSTLGNAVEMIMTVNFLRQHEYTVIKASMLGSVLSNMLLVLGMSFLLGGFKHKEQTFNKLGSSMWTSMLLLACLLLIILTVFANVSSINSTGDSTEALNKHQIKEISRMCACLMVVSYAASLVFTLGTHAAMMDDESGDQEENRMEAVENYLASNSQGRFTLSGREVPTDAQRAADERDRLAAEAEEREEQTPKITAGCAVLVLIVSTLVVAVSSDHLTEALGGALKGSPMGKKFLSMILLPIVGNACEHASAIQFALKNKAGTSVGIAIGSSVQIIVFVTPFSVLVGWLLGDDPTKHTNMDLDFGLLDSAVLTMSVLVVLAITLDGRSNWLEGFMLCTAYAMIALLYWFVV